MNAFIGCVFSPLLAFDRGCLLLFYLLVFTLHIISSIFSKLQLYHSLKVLIFDFENVICLVNSVEHKRVALSYEKYHVQIFFGKCFLNVHFSSLRLMRFVLRFVCRSARKRFF